MWVSKTRRAFRVSGRRRSSAFLELYGRAPCADTSAAQPSSSPAVADTDSALVACRALLQRIDAHLYIRPDQAPVTECIEALSSIERVVASSPARRSVAARGLWKDALALQARVPVSEVGAAADAATVLFLAGQPQRGCAVCRRVTGHQQFRGSLATEAALCECLRLLSVHVMCAGAAREQLSAEWWGFVGNMVDVARGVIAGADKAQRAPMARAMEVVAWSLDWLHHHHHHHGDSRSGETLAALRPRLPQWLPHLFAAFDAAVAAGSTSPSSLAVLPPRWVLAMAEHAAEDGDVAALERLLHHAMGREERCRANALFQLSARVADLLVRRFPRHPSAAHAVATFGTALECASLQPFGTTQEGFEAALAVLTHMSGPQPYAALQALLRHHPAETAAAVQERHGDVLTGSPGLSWRTALAAATQRIAAADPHWRECLPETLRLLSDAGTLTPFWRLLAEYNPADCGAPLSIAASLSRAMQRSGRWWHAVEVLDLLASAAAPRDATEDLQTSTACAETMRALLQARRWEDALHMFQLVGTVLPRSEAPVVSRLLTAMPAGAPWQVALASSENAGLVSATTRQTLLCLHADAPVSRLSREQLRKAAAATFAAHGRWDLVRAAVALHPTEVPLWRALVQALGRCADVVDDAVATATFAVPLPPGCWEDSSFVDAFARLCVQRGWLSLLSAHLTAVLASSRAPAAPLRRLCSEYEHLVCFLRTGRPPPADVVLHESYVVHHFVACVTRKRVSVVARLAGARATSKRHASAILRVPYESLGALRSGGDGSTTVRVTASPAVAAYPVEHCVFSAAGGHLLVGYKVPAAELFACARGMLRVLGNDGAYGLAYHMSAASSGLFLLLPASASLTWYSITLRVRLFVAVMVPEMPHVPLLATSFFRRYAMRWRGGGDGGGGDRHEVEADVVAENGQEVRHAWRSLKMHMNAEGWGPVELEAGAGDTYHIVELRVARRAPVARGGDDTVAEVKVFTSARSAQRPLSTDDADAVEWEL
ncbi:hypothetical protein NESM_000073900 [Novymonas esmeraldas]|uniref:Uncharacterized protein n=1 Tax=Novymonas esmeraldas TaxID=1808958 RepID=A0AAW0F3K9_9TRYP